MTLNADGGLAKVLDEERFAATLSYPEIEALLMILARSGVLDTSSQALEERIALRTGRHKPSEFVTDEGSTTITVTLDRYRRGDVVREPFEVSVGCVGLITVQAAYQDIPEVSGIMEVYRFLFKNPRLRKIEGGS